MNTQELPKEPEEAQNQLGIERKQVTLLRLRLLSKDTKKRRIPAYNGRRSKVSGIYS
jgi:hypothetical protein